MARLFCPSTLRLVTRTFTSSTTFTAPSTVNKLSVLTGKGGTGQPGTNGYYDPPINKNAYVTSVATASAVSGTATPGQLLWENLQANGTAARDKINAGGSGSFNRADYTQYPGDQTTARKYAVTNSAFAFSNVIAGSASLTFSAGWKTSGNVDPGEYFDPPINKNAYVTSVITASAVSSTATPGQLLWENLQANGTAARDKVNAGGSGSYNKADYTQYPGDQTTARKYAIANATIAFSNVIAGSASLTFSAGWKTSGNVDPGEYFDPPINKSAWATSVSTSATVNSTATGGQLLWDNLQGGATAARDAINTGGAGSFTRNSYTQYSSDKSTSRHSSTSTAGFAYSNVIAGSASLTFDATWKTSGNVDPGEYYEPAINKNAYVTSVYDDGVPSANGTPGQLIWDNLQANGTNGQNAMGGGGSGTFNRADYTQHPSGQSMLASYEVVNTPVAFSNVIPSSAFLSHSGGWKYTGNVVYPDLAYTYLNWQEYGAYHAGVNSTSYAYVNWQEYGTYHAGVNSTSYAYVNWQEYGTYHPGVAKVDYAYVSWQEQGAYHAGTPATTGGTTTAFGKSFVGGTGGEATPVTYNDVPVTPGANYAIDVAYGGSVSIQYYE